jgi:predicted TIM-barrel fold metal-dependent hydrolase
MIIDTHCHFGISKLSGREISEAKLLSYMDRYGIDLALVMPHAVTDDQVKAHEGIVELCQRFPERFRGIASFSPLLDAGDYRRAVARFVSGHGFVAVKLNPMQHLASPLMANSDKVFDTAADLGVPVIVHTGLGTPWALPSLSIPQARRHPDLSIILAHAGYSVYTAEAYVTASECPNIVLEPSWCSIHDLNWLIQKLGSWRILFGSDQPENIPVELAKYHSLDLQEEQQVDCLWRTAQRVFKLDVPLQSSG